MSFVRRLLMGLALACVVGLSGAWSTSIDKDIENLKHQDPEIRAKAAYELGCT